MERLDAQSSAGHRDDARSTRSVSHLGGARGEVASGRCPGDQRGQKVSLEAQTGVYGGSGRILAQFQGATRQSLDALLRPKSIVTHVERFLPRIVKLLETVGSNGKHS